MSFNSKRRKVLPRMSFALAISDAVRDALSKDRRSDKELARQVKCVPRAVRSWREGQSIPGVPNFIRLCREIPELRAVALRWLEADAEGDPEMDRLTLDTLRQITDHLERRQKRLREEGP